MDVTSSLEKREREKEAPGREIHILDERTEGRRKLSRPGSTVAIEPMQALSIKSEKENNKPAGRVMVNFVSFAVLSILLLDCTWSKKETLHGPEETPAPGRRMVETRKQTRIRLTKRHC